MITEPDPVRWSYKGETGPRCWGTLRPEFVACTEGTEQSPVDIPAGAPTNPPDLQFSYGPSALNIANNGYTIYVDYDPGSSLEVGGAAYNLVQFHLHSLSEHTFAGEHTPVELHLVHTAACGRIAVVGVMLVEGRHNEAYEPVLANLPAATGEPRVISCALVDAAALLPSDRSYYHYNGSLTTPPCSQGVTWFVMAKPVELSTGR